MAPPPNAPAATPAPPACKSGTSYETRSRAPGACNASRAPAKARKTEPGGCHRIARRPEQELAVAPRAGAGAGSNPLNCGELPRPRPPWAWDPWPRARAPPRARRAPRAPPRPPHPRGRGGRGRQRRRRYRPRPTPPRIRPVPPPGPSTQAPRLRGGPLGGRADSGSSAPPAGRGAHPEASPAPSAPSSTGGFTDSGARVVYSWGAGCGMPLYQTRPPERRTHERPAPCSSS